MHAPIQYEICGCPKLKMVLKGRDIYIESIEWHHHDHSWLVEGSLKIVQGSQWNDRDHCNVLINRYMVTVYLYSAIKTDKSYLQCLFIHIHSYSQSIDRVVYFKIYFNHISVVYYRKWRLVLAWNNIRTLFSATFYSIIAPYWNFTTWRLFVVSCIDYSCWCQYIHVPVVDRMCFEG